MGLWEKRHPMEHFNGVPAGSNASTDFGGWILVAASAASLGVSLFEYFEPGNGINHTWGVLLVVLSSALILAASLSIVLARPEKFWLRLFLNVSTCVGLIGTGCAAYFLEAQGLIGLMMLGLVGWLVHLFSRPRDKGRRPATGGGSQAAT